MAVPRRELGDSGVEVSLFALGSWRTWELIPREQAASVLDHARSRGIDFLEVARYNDESGSAPIPSGYSEVVFGEAFRASGWPRDEVTIGEKLWWEHWPQQSPSEELDLSLERTGLDHVDFLECDPPPADLPMEDIVGMMGELIAGGRARAWGIVNWEAERVAEAGRAARAAGVPAPKSAQLPYSLAKRDWVESPEMSEALDLCGASVMASYVLVGGILSGKYAQGGGEGRMAEHLDDPRMASAIAAVPALLELAERLGEPPAVLAMAFALSNPRVSTILTGATRPEQIDQNLRALDVLEGLGEEDLAALKAVGVSSAARRDRWHLSRVLTPRQKSHPAGATRPRLAPPELRSSRRRGRRPPPTAHRGRTEGAVPARRLLPRHPSKNREPVASTLASHPLALVKHR